MNGQTEGKLVFAGVIVLMVLFVLGVGRLAFVLPGVSYNDICNVKYGENWVYDNNNNFGKTCIELDYISLEVVNRTELNIGMREAELYREEIDKYCDAPGFWELSKWEDECEWED